MAQKNSTAKSLRPEDIGTDFLKPSQYISFSPPALGEEEEREILDSLRTGWITTGPKVKEFEQKLADYLKVHYAIAVTNGTIALDLALKVLGVVPGDEVIVPIQTFVSTGVCVINNGGTPVFCEINKNHIMK